MARTEHKLEMGSFACWLIGETVTVTRRYVRPKIADARWTLAEFRCGSCRRCPVASKSGAWSRGFDWSKCVHPDSPA